VTDLLFVAVAIAFFALAGAYVTGCERLVGRARLDGVADELVETDIDTADR
jgi:hypothetical protein